MIDINIIKEKYASMTDEQLIHLATNDSDGLTYEAIAILKQEFISRNLDMDVFIPVAKEQAEEEEEREPIAGFYNPATSAEDALLGRNYLSIKNPAQEMQLAEHKEKFMANLTEEELLALIKKCNSSMLKNTFIFTIGFAVTIMTYLPAAENGGSFIVAWGAMAIGGIGFISAYWAKNKYQSALKHIHNKSEELPENES
jgi:hypothetical protein